MDGTRIILLLIGCLLFSIFFIIVGYLERKEERERIHKEIMERNCLDHLGTSSGIIINKEYPKDITVYECDPYNIKVKTYTNYNKLEMKYIDLNQKDYISKDIIREKLGDLDIQYAYIKEHGLDEKEITTAKAQYYAMKELLEKFLDM